MKPSGGGQKNKGLLLNKECFLKTLNMRKLGHCWTSGPAGAVFGGPAGHVSFAEEI